MAIVLVVFVIVFIVAFASAGAAQTVLASQQKAQIRKMLRRAAAKAGKRRQDLVWEVDPASGVGALLLRFQIFQGMERLLMRAGLDWTLDRFVVLSFGAAFAGFLISFIIPFTARIAASHLAMSAAAGVLPLLYVNYKRKKRFAAFEEQFPEALNFLSRSMRAGHAFSIGLEMLVADAPEPLASSFRNILTNLQLGSPMEEALAELVESMPLIDVRFFVSSVLLQQGTGGNLGEILDTMARIIRERFRVKGAVKAASAHGRVTGGVLSVMPIIVAILMSLIAPDYLKKLVSDPLGVRLLEATIVGQFIGFFCVKKITTIKF